MQRTPLTIGVGANVRVRPRVLHYQPTKPVSVDAFVAQALRVTQGTAHQIMWGRDRTDKRMLAVVQGFLAAGKVVQAVRYTQPILDALAGIRPVALTDDLIADSQRLDLEEDISENEARAFPSRESRLRWASKAEAEAAALTKLAAALRAECAA